MSDHPEISFDQEAVLLNDMQDIWDGPWACHFCGDRMTNEIGGKPQVFLVGNERQTGVTRVVIDVFCGPCAQHQVQRQPCD